MYSEVSEIYNNANWNYLDISDQFINSRYDWVTISFPKNEDRKFPWAHEYDMIRLFLVSRTFTSKVEAKKSISVNLKNDLTPVHNSLINGFCYSEIEILESIDELIDGADVSDLLNFIQVALDRSLLWHNPEPCWPGDFKRILRVTSEKLKNETSLRLNLVDKPEVVGMDFVSGENYTHVFYKFQNLINGIEKGEIYYGIKDLSKQAHEALLKSMELFFEHLISSLNEESWERKLNEIALKETDWCKLQIMQTEKKHNMS